VSPAEDGSHPAVASTDINWDSLARLLSAPAPTQATDAEFTMDVRRVPGSCACCDFRLTRDNLQLLGPCDYPSVDANLHCENGLGNEV
jgi:hypothetical protein